MNERWISVSITKQQLSLNDAHGCLMQWPVSTASKGAGNHQGSLQTPLGQHRIRASIGANAPTNAVFVGRRMTGEIYCSALAQQHPERDWILTRILWLCGEEKGLNRGANVDSQRRYIYIHGTPDSEPMGEPHSHGCIRMRNHDVIELFDQVRPGTKVIISQ